MKSNKRNGLFSILLSLAAALTAQAANAESFEMSVVIDRAHGELVRQGDYDDAIRSITHGDHRLPFASSNNLCVAQTMSGLFQQANASCDSAVTLAEQAAQRGRRRDIDYVTELAIALSNRGVLRARTGDSDGAEEDFSRAVSLNAATDTPERNFTLMKNG